MRDHVRFRSARFKPTKPEDEQVNPGRYGEELAAWLSEQLSASGASEPQAEDWGWFLTFDAPAKALFLGCGNVAGENDHWVIFLRERTGFLAKLIGRSGAESDAKRRVIVALDAALRAEASVSEIEWFSEGPDRQELDHASHPE
jgi:hypothetical protein